MLSYAKLFGGFLFQERMEFISSSNFFISDVIPPKKIFFFRCCRIHLDSHEDAKKRMKEKIEDSKIEKKTVRAKIKSIPGLN